MVWHKRARLGSHVAESNDRRMRMTLGVLPAQVLVKLDGDKLCALVSGLIILGLDPNNV